MGRINDLFRCHGEAYIAQYGDRLTPQQRKVIRAIQQCRSGEHGRAHYRCEGCNEDTVVTRGCGNRHCPGCQHRKAQRWLQRQLARQCPGHRFMLTFTVPDSVRDFFMRHPREAYTPYLRRPRMRSKRSPPTTSGSVVIHRVSSVCYIPGVGNCNIIRIFILLWWAGHGAVSKSVGAHPVWVSFCRCRRCRLSFARSFATS